MKYTVPANAIDLYRRTTHESHKRMAGVHFMSFVCRVCGQPRPIRGRKSLGHKAGFQCATCANPGENE